MKEIDYLYLYPAYGNTYKTVEDMRKDWEDGKDFSIPHGFGIRGKYCSIRNMEQLASISNRILLFDPQTAVCHFVN